MVAPLVPGTLGRTGVVMAEAIGVIISAALLVGGILLGLQQKGAIPWGDGWSLLLIAAGGLGLLYFLVIGAGHRRDARDRGRSS